jgi:hypothetical protein
VFAIVLILMLMLLPVLIPAIITAFYALSDLRRRSASA